MKNLFYLGLSLILFTTYFIYSFSTSNPVTVESFHYAHQELESITVEAAEALLFDNEMRYAQDESINLLYSFSND